MNCTIQEVKGGCPWMIMTQFLLLHLMEIFGLIIEGEKWKYVVVKGLFLPYCN